jgi:drug/metabolite transporter (DMT)-like permease
MDTTFWRVRARSFWAYVLLFGALFGYVTFGVSAFVSPTTGTPDRGLFLIWIAAALGGSMLLALRNRRVPDWRVKRGLYLSDGLILAALFVLIQLTPAYVGLVRSAMVVAVASAYVAIYRKIRLRAPAVRHGGASRVAHEGYEHTAGLPVS